jgi:hypothetical protein
VPEAMQILTKYPRLKGVGCRKDDSSKDNPALKSSGATSLINMETVPKFRKSSSSP